MRHALRRAMPPALLVVTSLVPSAGIALAFGGAAAGEGTAASSASVDAVPLIQRKNFPDFEDLQKLGDSLQRMMAKREEEAHPDRQEHGVDPGLEAVRADATLRDEAIQRIEEQEQAKVPFADDPFLSPSKEGLLPAKSKQQKPEVGADPAEATGARGGSAPTPWKPTPKPETPRPPARHEAGEYSDLELDGGGQPWVLFNDEAPDTLVRGPQDEEYPEAFVPTTPSTNQNCATAHEEKGYRYYNVTVPHLVPFVLPDSDRKKNDAALIVLPGGRGLYLSWHKEGTRVAKWLNSMGYSAFVLKYRVPAKKEGGAINWLRATIDGQRALRLVRSRAGELGLNPERVGVIGFGTGGVLAAHLSRASPKYMATDEADKERHRPDYQLMIYAADVPYPSMIYQDIQPTFMAIARDDACMSSKQAIRYYEQLIQSGNGNVPNEMHIFAEGGHGYGDCSLYAEGMMMQEACAWTLNAAAYMRSVVLHERDEIPAFHRRA